MPFLDDLKRPFSKIILGSPLHGLLSEDQALITFTDHFTGRRKNFVVPYQKEQRIIRVLCAKQEKSWKIFTYGSPLKIFIRGNEYQGWGEIIDDPEELQKEWRALIRSKPELFNNFEAPELIRENASISDNIVRLSSELDILRIEVSGRL